MVEADIKTIGDTEDGGLLFEIDILNDDKYTYFPSKKMYGLQEHSGGEEGVFNFIEIAFSEKPIHSLQEGLRDGGRYFVGVTCVDRAICDFRKARPTARAHTQLGFTPK